MKARLDKRPSIDETRASVSYDEDRDALIWLVTRGRAIAGQEAGGVDKSTGYRRVNICGYTGLLVHHVVFALAHGRWPEQLDHEDGDKTNCRPGNLRESNQSQNAANRGKQINNKSGFKSVFWHKASERWASQIKVRGVGRWLGTFDTPEEAHAAYEKAAKEEFGEFAKSKEHPTAAPRATKAPRRKGQRPTPDEVRTVLSYDPETGILRWKRALSFRGQIGAEAGRINYDGYRRIGLFGKQYPGHVLAWVIVVGQWPTFVIHHVDGRRDCNVWTNLAQVTQSENIQAIHENLEPLHYQRPDVIVCAWDDLGNPVIRPKISSNAT